MVGTGLLVHHPTAEDRESPLVARHWSCHRNGSAHQVLRCLFRGWPSPRTPLHACPPLLHQPLVLGRVAIALVLFLPNIVWLIRHDFISYHFLQHIHARDVGEGRAEGYWKYQFLLDVIRLQRLSGSSALSPLCATAVIAFLRGCTSSRFCFSGSTRAASTTSRKPIRCCLLWVLPSLDAALRSVRHGPAAQLPLPISSACLRWRYRCSQADTDRLLGPVARLCPRTQRRPSRRVWLG